MIVDSHCHLDFANLALDREGVLSRAENAGIETILTISTRLSQFPDILSIAEDNAQIYCSVGVHPHNADEEGVDRPAELVARVSSSRVVGIGETGLDYFYERSSPQAQRRNFLSHIAASRETGLPLIVHARDADEDTMKILSEERAKGPFSGVIHCFTGSRALAEAAIELGLYVSFSGIITFKNAQEIRDIARDLPADRILVETDAPFLAPIPHRGKQNEPSFVIHTAQCLARLRALSHEALYRLTTENFYRLFSKASPPSAR